MLSLKLHESIFTETDQIARTLNVSRNAYINEALKLYNAFNNRRRLKALLVSESRMVANESLAVLQDFEQLADA